ncbi:MAG: penicillin acylase family protein, partial [Armatimonadetes bacterium]|nr:penicillin acylase family protein [Armatimonadota bacterium]
MIVEALRTVPDWEALASRLGCSLPEARAQVRSYLHSRLPPASGTVKAAGFTARIQHDAWGVPHIFGADEPSAYCGLGLAMGLDRFWQMDYLRRLGSGTLAEVLGPGSLANDRLHRTLNLRRTAAEVVRGYEPETRACVDAFCVGVNRAREVLLEQGLPFEFELLDYTPAEWSPVDTETVLRVFWWQLTGRFFFLSVPEHSRRILGSGPLLEALLTPEG